MSGKKFILFFFGISFLNSCFSPAQKIIDSSVINETPSKLNEIIQKTGQLSDEDINITVYKIAVQSVVAINTTSLSRSFFSLQPVKGTGSGFFISKNGYILTNYHVVSDASKLQVTLADRSTWDAKPIG